MEFEKLVRQMDDLKEEMRTRVSVCTFGGGFILANWKTSNLNPVGAFAARITKCSNCVVYLVLLLVRTYVCRLRLFRAMKSS